MCLYTIEGCGPFSCLFSPPLPTLSPTQHQYNKEQPFLKALKAWLVKKGGLVALHCILTSTTTEQIPGDTQRGT